MRPRIALPVPHSADPEYAARSLPQYTRAVELAGGEAVTIPLNSSRGEVEDLIGSCDAVLLPGSRADVDPGRFRAARRPETAETDVSREVVDDQLLIDAYRQKKPVFGICYGLQSLNVNRGGSLIQDIRSFLPEGLRDAVNHDAGRRAPVAHTVTIEADSMLAEAVRNNARAAHESSSTTSIQDVPVNSSHHQAADAPGKGLRIVARCPVDGIVEALEGTDPAHFVVAVQWHPERSIDGDEPSRALFQSFVRAANEWRISNREQARESAR